MEPASDSKQTKPENEFENIENQTIIQLLAVRQQQCIYQAHCQSSYNTERQHDEQNRLELLEGNPILPPGKHHLRQQPQFRLKFLSMREKFNKTTFQKQGKSLKNLKAELSVREQIGKCKLESRQDSEDIEFLQLLETRKLIYKRINNSKINFLGKERLLCSVFFDWKKQKITSKEPIYQYLVKTKRLKCDVAQKDWLSFSSSFESGNLLFAVKDSSTSIPTYELYMQNDVNTKGCTQWFFFSVMCRSRGKAKLRIMNFYKPTSLYQKGMKILFSYDGAEWKRTGTSISYYKTNMDKSSFSLDFIHEFQLPQKETYFAYGYPYTYNQHLYDYLAPITSEVKFQKIVHKSIVCVSSMGNPIHMLSISNFSQKKESSKPLVYVIGRQHPGETPASYIVQGLINFLLSNAPQAKQLREKYEFRVVPMVNVDGVISGNYRSNLSGTDINRQWQFPSKRGQPEVFWLKQEIANNKKQTVFFLDIHAHSRKMNSFFYGSNMASRENRLFPFVCSRMNKFISYNQSAFTDDPSKRTTARVILETELGISQSLTYEVSFYGWTDPVKQVNISFKQGDLRSMGESLGISFYHSLIGIQRARQANNSTLPKFHNDKQKTMLKNSIKLLDKWNKQLQKELNEQIRDDYSEGSSLNPEHFQLRQDQKEFIAEMMKTTVQDNSHKKELTRNISAPKDQKNNSRKKMLIYSTLQPSENQQSQLLAPKSQAEQKSLGISSNQFSHFSSTARGAKKQPFSVRELQLELQVGAEAFPERKLRGLRLRMGHQNQILSGFDRYQSLNMEREKNYKNDVLQMKKALKYLLQSKSSDYDQYKSCFKAFNNELIGGQRTQRSNK